MALESYFSPDYEIGPGWNNELRPRDLTTGRMASDDALRDDVQIMRVDFTGDDIADAIVSVSYSHGDIEEFLHVFLKRTQDDYSLFLPKAVGLPALEERSDGVLVTRFRQRGTSCPRYVTVSEVRLHPRGVVEPPAESHYSNEYVTAPRIDTYEDEACAD
jgi:hypothetical protein